MGLRVDENRSFRSQQAKSKSKHSTRKSKIKQFPHWTCPHNQWVATTFVFFRIKGVESHIHGFSMKSELVLGFSLCYRKGLHCVISTHKKEFGFTFCSQIHRKTAAWPQGLILKVVSE